MSELIHAFAEVSQKMLECLRASAEAETEKRRALLDHDMDRIETILQEQQAVTMRLENMEKRRLEAQEKAGFAGMKPEEILAAVKEPALKAELSDLFRDLWVAADKLRELNRASIDIAKMELRMMGSAVPGNGPEDGLYTAGGRKGETRGAGSSFDGKI